MYIRVTFYFEWGYVTPGSYDFNTKKTNLNFVRLIEVINRFDYFPSKLL